MQHRHVYMARTYVLTLSTIVPVLRSECINTYNTQKPNTRVFNTQKMENIRILRAQVSRIVTKIPDHTLNSIDTMNHNLTYLIT